MNAKRLFLFFMIAALAAGGSWAHGTLAEAHHIQIGPVRIPPMHLKSRAFRGVFFRRMPREYTCYGSETSPGFEVTGAPDGTKSLALFMSDPAASDDKKVLWAAYNIPPSGVVADDQSPGIEVLNSFGKAGYTAPCPSPGRHVYVLKICALDAMLNLGGKVDHRILSKIIEDHVLVETEFKGVYW